MIWHERDNLFFESYLFRIIAEQDYVILYIVLLDVLVNICSASFGLTLVRQDVPAK